MNMKEEKEKCKDISTRHNQDCILMKERVEESLWTVVKSGKKKDMTTDHHFVVTRNELVMYEDFMHPIV